jgi:hypothetical protein
MTSEMTAKRFSVTVGKYGTLLNSSRKRKCVFFPSQDTVGDNRLLSVVLVSIDRVK